MEAPDKIYIDYGLIDYHCLDEQKVDGIEYIRKEALLEWAKKEKDKWNEPPASYADVGALWILDKIIDKLELLWHKKKRQKSKLMWPLI